MAIIAVGLVFSVARGLNYGIDFTGGTMIQVDLHRQVPIAEVEQSIEEYELDPSIIYSGEENTQVVIKTMEFLDNDQRADVIDTMGEHFDISDEDVLASEQFGPL